jgi:hypothetical protein
MTLREVGTATGVPAAYIISALKLPPSVSPDQNLGFLKRVYGFEINQVRQVIKDFRESKE